MIFPNSRQTINLLALVANFYDIGPMLEGKISVSHYLNTKLRKTEVSKKDARYPVYLRLRFAGRQTEIKSNYFLFFDTSEQPIHDPMTDVGFEYMRLSEKEFRETDRDKGLKKAIEREAITVREIISFFAKKDVNIIDFDTKFVITKSLHTLELIVSEYSKYEMQDFLAKKKHMELYSLFDWKAPFTQIFEGIRILVDDGRNTTKMKEFFLDRFQKHYDLLTFLKAFKRPQIRVYQWQDGSDLKTEIISLLDAKSKNKSKDLVTIIDHACIRHFNFLESVMDK